MTHKKTILEKYAKANQRGLKPWEVRRNDCDYQVNDLIEFTVIHNETKEPTGLVYSSKITYLFKGGEYGLAKGYCIMTLA